MAYTENQLLRKLKNGWTLHIWRNSSPHNIWLSGPRKELHFEGADRMWFGKLKKYCKLKSLEGTVTYPNTYFRGSDAGQPIHEIWEFDPEKLEEK